MMGGIRSRLVDGEGDGSGPPDIGSPNGLGFQRAASGPPGSWRGSTSGWRGGSDTGEGPMPRGGLRPMHVSLLLLQHHPVSMHQQQPGVRNCQLADAGLWGCCLPCDLCHDSPHCLCLQSREMPAPEVMRQPRGPGEGGMGRGMGRGGGPLGPPHLAGPGPGPGGRGRPVPQSPGKLPVKEPDAGLPPRCQLTLVIGVFSCETPKWSSTTRECICSSCNVLRQACLPFRC